MLPLIVGVMSISEAFGQIVRGLRQKKGLSQEDLAGLCGLHRNAIGLLERGERIPSIETAFALAHGLGIKPSTLMRKLETNPSSGAWKPRD